MRFAKCALTLWVLLCPATYLCGEDVTERCFNSVITSVPSRPTVSNSTETTQCGVVELEYGWERQVQSGQHQTDFTGGLRLGLTRNLDFHWASTEFLSVTQAGRDDSGLGDNWLGLKYRFSHERRYVPSFGVFYQIKIPSSAKNLGSGYVDHSISLLASKDVRQIHFDFNVTPLIAGSRLGFNHNTGMTLSASIPVSRRLSVVTEGYGYTRLNAGQAAFASSMAGVTYAVNRLLMLDSGLDVGVTHNAPQRRAYVGATYAIGNAFSWIRPKSD